MKKSFKIIIFVDIILILITGVIIGIYNFELLKGKKESFQVPEQYKSSKQIKEFKERYQKIPNNAVFSRGLGTKGEKKQMQGFDLVGQLEKIDQQGEVILVRFEENVIKFDISGLETVFVLKHDCNNFYSLCVDKNNAGLDTVNLDQFYEINWKKGSRTRLLVNEASDQGSVPKVNEIIFEKQ